MTHCRLDEESEIKTRRGFLRAAVGGWIGASAFPGGQLRDTSPLKITRIEPYVLRIGERTSYPCVRIQTADGIHGSGEGTTPPSTPAVIAQIRECGKLIMNQSAWDIEKLWRHIVQRSSSRSKLYCRGTRIDQLHRILRFP